ncbi:hypothetical protein H257_18254 [Aphanomyces astaci]|uniref:Uncharacterized protein n=1 Tax=Aphanomyces astaci TaxID=112090 RepID=W4FDZ3_APHAT|nr:hypothetical protein H257_18254 [Aphanomyces astaci]ETV64958.1 hypothetical protein H257_18254 [Aphanomyces astaci]|eukprot:XP_009845582.1 hypothetical protein H257_18254 [Aphanomyces astaci]
MVGVVSVRQDDWGGAEMALTEANVLDRTYADVWGVPCAPTPPRLREAEQALEQALRCDLANTTLLRELSNGFVAVDKLEVAESLLREQHGRPRNVAGSQQGADKEQHHHRVDGP